MERISPSVREALHSSRESCAQKLQSKCSSVRGKDDKAGWVAHYNKVFLEEACRLLSKVEFSRKALGYCHKCHSMVPLHPPQTNSKILVNISGTTCVAWSAMSQGASSELGWLHPSAEPCLVWLHEQAAIKNHFIIHECVRGFDNSCFKKVLGDGWHVCTVRFSAKSTGVPVDRTRAYTVACSEAVHCHLPFSMELVRRILFHEVNCDCSVYLQADEALTLKHREALAPHSVRHLAPRKRYRGSSLLCTGDAFRLGLWRAALEQKVEASSEEKKDIVRRHFVNVGQEAGYMALPKDVVVPALLRGSKLFRHCCGQVDTSIGVTGDPRSAYVSW